MYYMQGARDFLYSPKCTDCLWSLPSLVHSRYQGSFAVVKRPGREVSHSPPFTAKVKNVGDYTYTSLIWHGQGKLYIYLYSQSLYHEVLLFLFISPYSNTFLVFIFCCH